MKDKGKRKATPVSVNRISLVKWNLKLKKMDLKVNQEEWKRQKNDLFLKIDIRGDSISSEDPNIDEKFIK